MDAYTIRKVLPRLVIAIIFINLSWPILQYLIQLTNDVGMDVRSIIYAPFSSIYKSGVVRIGGGATTTAALLGVGGFALGLIGVGALVTAAFFAVAVVFIALLLRQVIIMMLIVSAPLAIACYVLPATEKLWKFWRDILIDMLIAFPIISAFIAMGQVGAVVLYNASIYSAPAFTAIGRMFGISMGAATLQSLPPTVKQLGGAILGFGAPVIGVFAAFKVMRSLDLIKGKVQGMFNGGGGKGANPENKAAGATAWGKNFERATSMAPDLCPEAPGSGKPSAA